MRESEPMISIGPAGQQTYRAIVLINPAAAAAILPNLKTKIVITQSIFELGPRNFEWK